MRQQTTTVTIYEYGELEDDAKANAIANVRDWYANTWDGADIETTGEEMLWAFAEALRAPGWDTYGPGDFPGVPGLTVESWDIGRGESWGVRGTLRPEHAPALPWPADVVALHVDQTGRIGTDDRYLDTEDDRIYDDDRPDVAALWEAWRDACHAAIKAGRDSEEYRSSDDYVTEEIEANEYEFLEDGTLFNS